jgi:hypothetical protein
MANPHSTDNYAVGKGILTIAEFSGGSPGSYSDVGNCTNFEVEPTQERLPHLSNRSGFRTKDKNPIIQMEYSATFDLDEMAASNLKRYLMGTLTDGMQVLALQDADKEFALRFTSDNPVGPNQVWDLWKVTMSPNGPIQLIGDDWMVMSHACEGLSDIINHPESPYITVDYEAGYTETSASESSSSTSSSSESSESSEST